jgi:copper chaperone CopZ
MYNSEDVAAVRTRLERMPGVSAVNVDLRKMQAQMTASKVIGAPALRNALGNTNFEPSGLTASAITPPFGARDDEAEEPGSTI